MKSYLHQLENNEAILLMYLADELPAQDRAEVEEMLASDAKLRAQLENLGQTQQLADDALESLDAMTRPAIPPLAAQNQISLLIRNWLDGRGRTAKEPAPSARHFPWWRSSFAAAAAMMIGYYIWAVYHPPDTRFMPAAQRDLSDDEKLAFLDYSFRETPTEDLNLHVAEVAAVVPSDIEDMSDSSVGTDSNSTGAP